MKRSPLFLQYLKFHATVLLLAFGSVILGNRLGFTVTLAGNAVGLDTFSDQVLANGVGPLLREVNVKFGATGVIGMPAEFDREGFVFLH